MTDHKRNPSPEKLSSQQAFFKGFNKLALCHYKDALPLLNQAAIDHYPPAYLFLGIIYKNGYGVGRDASKANYYFQKAKENIRWFHTQAEKNSFSLYCLGELYFYDQTVPANLEQAVEYFQKAANLGEAAALYKLGRHYENNEKNWPRAIECLEKAAALGYAEAMDRLGAIYYKGKITTQNKEKAFAYFQRAAAHGSAAGQYNQGFCYLEGEGVSGDANKAFDCFQLPAQQGIAKAYCCMGICYFEGNGVSKDAAMAFRCFKKAAELMDVEAQTWLGICYLRGEVVPQDLNKAIDCFEIAATQGDSLGQNYLSFCYKYGRGVEKDFRLSTHWQKCAITKGNRKEQILFKKLAKTDFNDGYEKDPAKILSSRYSLFGEYQKNQTKSASDLCASTPSIETYLTHQASETSTSLRRRCGTICVE